MSAAGMSQWEIVRVIRRSKTAVYGLLRNPEGYNTARCLDRRSNLAPATIRRIVRAAQTGQYSSSQLVRTLDLIISARSARGVLAHKDTLCYVKRKSSPVLTKTHKLTRLEWVRASVTLGANWETVIFSDEKILISMALMGSSTTGTTFVEKSKPSRGVKREGVGDGVGCVLRKRQILFGCPARQAEQRNVRAHIPAPSRAIHVAAAATRVHFPAGQRLYSPIPSYDAVA